MMNNDLTKEQRQKDSLEREVKNLKAEMEMKDKEMTHLKDQLQANNKVLGKLEQASKEQKVRKYILGY